VEFYIGLKAREQWRVRPIIGRPVLGDDDPCLGEPEQSLTDPMHVGLPCLQRDPNRKLHPQPQVALVQFGEKLLAEECEDEQRDAEQDCGGRDGDERSLQ